jgi:hypothetical protein
MKKLFQAAVVTAAVLALPAMSLAAQAKPAATAKAPATQTSSAQATTPAKAPAAKAGSTAKTASAAAHSARGVVKSLDASSRVITQKAGKSTKEMSFVLDNSTQKEGDVAVGTPVQVTYHNAAKQHVASAVKATSAKKS